MVFVPVRCGLCFGQDEETAIVHVRNLKPETGTAHPTPHTLHPTLYVLEQVRKLMDGIGFRVLRLLRTAIGPIRGPCEQVNEPPNPRLSTLTRNPQREKRTGRRQAAAGIPGLLDPEPTALTAMPKPGRGHRSPRLAAGANRCNAAGTSATRRTRPVWCG